MVRALPRNIQFKLEQTLSQWPHWQCAPALTRAPNVVRTLTPGFSNFSVLVECGRHFVVRIDGLDPASNGLNRRAEWRTIEAAHKAGLAPHPRYFNPEVGSLVCDYLEPVEIDNGEITAVGKLLHAIHQLPARHHRLDLNESILRYERQVAQKGPPLNAALRASGNEVLKLLTQIKQQPFNAVLCHNDLLRANRIYSAGKLWALDWEYCAMGNPWYDIAVIVNGDLLTKSDTDTLLKAYLGRSPSTQERRLLYQYSCIYRYLELLWYLALKTPALDMQSIEEKSVALTGMLSQGSI